MEKMVRDMQLELYRGRRVFVTGHTGFKGTWLCKILTMAGAQVTGYSLPAPTEPSLFELSGIEKDITSVIGDIRDRKRLMAAFGRSQPEIVFHLAAQPIVLEGYREPAYTYETNVMGTVNILECVRNSDCVRSFLNVTTDKVYENTEKRGCREDDRLDGFDPYSNSKSCSELVTHCYKRSFFSDGIPAVSSARAGNVIGGGDFAADRIIPDCVRAAQKGSDIIVRNPYSVRPYQHVLEPLFAYLMIAREQFEDSSKAGYYNVGPDEGDCVSTKELVRLFCDKFGDIGWVDASEKNAPRESAYLKLDCGLLKNTFGWVPRWNIETAVDKTVEWLRVYLDKGSISDIMEKQILEFMRG
ncbi:MAG: CDP-glucose 4,6-dehydratase [Oscillospiraceae bacterium]